MGQNATRIQPKVQATSNNDEQQNKANAQNLGRKVFTLNFSFSSVLTLCIVLIVGIGWAFVMGVMVGRGQNPEQELPTISTLLPSNKDKSAQKESVENSKNKSDEYNNFNSSGEIMRPEELQFASLLEGKPGQESTEHANFSPKDKDMAPVKEALVVEHSANPKSDPNNSQNSADYQSQIDRLNQIQSQNNAINAPAVNQVEQKTPVEQNIQAKVFNYQYQVASFKKIEQVDTLRAQLEGEGMRTKMEQKGSFYRTVVLLRGTEAQASQLISQLEKLHLGRPILLNKEKIE